MRVKNICLNVIFIFTMSLAVYAESDIYEEMFQVMKYDSLIQSVNAQTKDKLINLQKEFVKKTNLSEAEQNEYIQTITGIINKTIDEKLSSEEFKKISVEVLKKYYSEAEVREMINFYKSPVGQKNLELMPKILMDIQAWTVNKNKELMKEISSQMREAGRKYKESGK